MRPAALLAAALLAAAVLAGAVLAGAVLAGAVLAGAAPAAAQQPAAGERGRLTLELSRLEPADGACRAYVTMENRTQADLAVLRLDVFLFAPDRSILSRVAVASGRVRPDRVRVLVFDVPDVPCQRVGSVLVNGVLVCQEQGGRLRDDCEDLIAVRSRVQVPLVN